MENVSSSCNNAVSSVGTPKSNAGAESVCPWLKPLVPKVGTPDSTNNAPRVSSSDIELAGTLAAPVVMAPAVSSYSSLPAPAKVVDAKGLVPNIYCS